MGIVSQAQGLLPKPVTLTFDTEAEGDAYCAHLEKLLDAGGVSDEFKTRTKAMVIPPILAIASSRDV